MSILRRILGGGEGERSEDGPDWIDLGDQRGELPEGALPLRASGGGLRLVGESHYREAIAAVAGGRRRQSVKLVTWASLVPEPENPYDTNAVGAYIDGHKVGHLSRQDAAAFAPVLARITAAGLTAYARADIFGGWDRGPSDRGDYGITVYASPADEQARMLDRRLDGKSARDVAATTPAMRAGRKQGPGMVRGRPHSDWHPEVKRLADLGDDSAAEALLLEICDATEIEAAFEGFGVAPAAYERLAVMYRRQGNRAAEIAILERFAAQPHAPGAMPSKLGERLERLRAQTD